MIAVGFRRRGTPSGGIDAVSWSNPGGWSRLVGIANPDELAQAVNDQLRTAVLTKASTRNQARNGRHRH